MIDKLLNNIEKIESGIFNSIRNNKYLFNKNDMKFLNNFGDEAEKIREFSNVISDIAYNNFTESLRSITISQGMRNLYIQVASESDIYADRELNVNNIAELKNIAGTIIDFKPAIKKLKRQYDEYLEIENSNSIFDETKIDKKQILTYITQLSHIDSTKFMN